MPKLSNLRVSPLIAAWEDVNELMRGEEPPNPAELLRPGVYKPEEVLLNAMGRQWVLNAADAPDDTRTSWEECAMPWLKAYTRAYFSRVHNYVIERVQEEICGVALARGRQPTLDNQVRLDELCSKLALVTKAAEEYVQSVRHSVD
jgi:hypothetical protein